MSTTYDEWKSTEPDPWEDWEPRMPTRELVATFVRGGGEYRGEAISDTEQDGDDWSSEDQREDEPELDWSELNNEPSNINIITGEVEK